jgi:small nuclear ribonucleoprotein (snRNP)-like protein
MELRRYLNKKVKVELKNKYFYEGVVQTVDDNSISLIDKNNKWVDISHEMISFIREIDDD